MNLKSLNFALRAPQDEVDSSLFAKVQCVSTGLWTPSALLTRQDGSQTYLVCQIDSSSNVEESARDAVVDFVKGVKLGEPLWIWISGRQPLFLRGLALCRSVSWLALHVCRSDRRIGYLDELQFPKLGCIFGHRFQTLCEERWHIGPFSEEVATI